jgi:hypothetical protein
MTNKQLSNLLTKQLKAFGSLLVVMLLALPCKASESNAPHASHVGNMILSVNGDRISVQIENQSLQRVLEELEKQARIKVMSSKFIGDRVISLSFERLLLSDALKRILRDRSYIVSTDGNGISLRVLGNYASRASLPLSSSIATPKTTTAFTEEFPQENLVIDRTQNLYVSNPELRLAALKELAQKGKANEIMDAQPELIAALEDEGEDVRTRKLALETLDRLKEGVPIDTLAFVASDTDPDMRAQALGLIAERGTDEAAQYLSQAMDDPDPKVRSFALEVSEYFSDL